MPVFPDQSVLKKRHLIPFLSYRHSSVRNNLKLSTNGLAKTIVGNIDGSSFIMGEDIFSLISINSSLSKYNHLQIISLKLIKLTRSSK
jgi:hypothetical protein